MFSTFRNQKKESDLANALAQWRKVEATLSCKDAEYKNLLSENRRLHDDFADLQGQLENVGTDANCRTGLTAGVMMSTFETFKVPTRIIKKKKGFTLGSIIKITCLSVF